MRDYKSKTTRQATATRFTRTKVKPNRKRKEPRPPYDWKKLIGHCARYGSWFGMVAVIVCSVGIVFGIGKYAIYDSPFFRVETVQVISNGRVDEEKVRELAAIRHGESMFDLDLNRIGTNIEENPWIASAQVERVFPRTVTIQIKEYVPAAIINLGCLYYVAEDGTVFKPLEMGEKIDYPLLTGIEQQAILDRPEEARQLLAGAVKLATALRTHKTFHLGKVSEIHIDFSQGYDLLTLDGGVPIKIGFDQFETKLARLERIFSELEPRLPVTQYIDLNAVDRVIVKLDPILTQPKPEKS